MKFDKSEKGCPISYENSLVAKPHHCLVLPLAVARSGGDEGRGALVRAGSVYGFHYARIADPCYGKRYVKRVSEPVLRKVRCTHEQPSINSLTRQTALVIPAIPEGSKLLAGGKRQRHLRWITSRGAKPEWGKKADSLIAIDFADRMDRRRRKQSKHSPSQPREVCPRVF